ncbi:hypothetical protein Q5P01_017870 [Channa striata]|uniref:Uncharacterized protein n=1 Tax=Channa striata TaxID=64152 RepID=A0AA88M3X9_CHASR|nr:hypothetical protein Q5P01_017870 [Channa striata]
MDPGGEQQPRPLSGYELEELWRLLPPRFAGDERTQQYTNGQRRDRPEQPRPLVTRGAEHPVETFEKTAHRDTLTEEEQKRDIALAYNRRDAAAAAGGCAWLIGYKVILVAASLRAAASYTRMKLNALIEKARRTQLLALSTTGRSEALALHREKRLSQVPAGLEGSRYSKRSFGQLEEIPFHLYDRYTEAPVFWCVLASSALLYNTIHLALTPVEHVAPLFFGAPTYVMYWGLLRGAQIALG